MATHSSLLAWRIPWTEEPGGLHSPWGHKRLTRLGRHAGVYPERIPFGCHMLASCLHFCLIVSIMKSTLACQSPQVRDSALLGPSSDKIRKEAVGNQLVHPLHPHYPMQARVCPLQGRKFGA